MKNLGEVTTEFTIATRDAKVFRIVYVIRATTLFAAVVVKAVGTTIATATDATKHVITVPMVSLRVLDSPSLKSSESPSPNSNLSRSY